MKIEYAKSDAQAKACASLSYMIEKDEPLTSKLGHNSFPYSEPQD